MRIDSHHHVWDLAVREQDWIVGEAMQPIAKTFTMQDLEPDLEKAKIDYTVLVQTVAVPEETPEFLEIASKHPKVAGVVGWLEMDSEDITPALDKQLSHPGSKHLVSIRDLAQGKKDPMWLGQPSVIENIKRLGQNGLSYDLLTYPHQLVGAIAAVKACPSVQFVMDHISKPDIANGDIDNWAKDIRALAELPNVVVKVSGMVTEAKWYDWTVDTFRPYFDVLSSSFGPKRMMFGSDWPVCTLGGSYEDVVGILESLTSDWSIPEQNGIWSETAVSAYRLEKLVS